MKKSIVTISLNSEQVLQFYKRQKELGTGCC